MFLVRIGCLVYLAAHCAVSHAMETEESLVISEQELKDYSEQKLETYSENDSLPWYQMDCVYNMVQAKDLNELIDYTARVAHFLPVKIVFSQGSHLIISSYDDLLRSIKSRIKTKNTLSIDSVFVQEHEIYMKFWRAYIDHQKDNQDPDFIEQKISLGHYLTDLLEKRSSYL